MYGFPCCTERVTNPDYDSEGNAYGKKGDESCIIPIGCTKCIINATKSETMPSLSSKWRKTFNHKKSKTSSDKMTQSASKKKTKTSSTQTSSGTKKTASKKKTTKAKPTAIGKN